MEWKFYLLLYPDLRYNGILTEVDSRHHFYTYGEKEGRIGSWNVFFERYTFNPCCFPVLTKFIKDWCEWEIHNNDRGGPTIPQYVFKKIGLTVPREQYEFSFLMTSFDQEEMFDSMQYSEMYPDAVTIDNKKDHFLTMFRKEKRHGSVLHAMIQTVQQYRNTFFSSFSCLSTDALVRWRRILDSKIPLDMDWKAFRKDCAHSHSFFQYSGRFIVALYFMYRESYHYQTPCFFIHEGRKVVDTTVHIVSGVSVGGYYQYSKELSYLVNFHGYKTNLIRNLSDFQKLEPNRSCDILWISHLLHTNIRLHHFHPLLDKHHFIKIVLTVHDLSLFNYFDDKENTHRRNIHSTRHLPGRFSTSLTSFLDRVSTILCPARWVQDAILKHYPLPHKVLFSLHPDVCHYERPFSKPICTEYVNLCIPHEISFLKGELFLQRIAPFLTTIPYIRIYLYGSVIKYFTNSIPCGRYDGDEFFDWVKRDHIHGFLLLNDHPETYSYGFSKCISTGLPCLYNDVEGAIGERARQFKISGMYALKGSGEDLRHQMDAFIQLLRENSTVPTKNTAPGREMVLETPPVYQEIFRVMVKNNVDCPWVKPFAVYCAPYRRILLENETNAYLVANGETSSIPDAPLQRINYPTHDDFSLIPNAVSKQALLASRFGFQGFALYHDWCSKNSRTTDLFFAPTAQLPDNFKLFFMIGSQTKYEECDCKTHFQSLVAYFSNVIYLKENNRPVVFLHSSFRLSSSWEQKTLQQTWDREARNAGFDGLQIIFYGTEDGAEDAPTRCIYHPDENIMNKVQEKSPFSSSTFLVSMKQYAEVMEERYRKRLLLPTHSAHVEVAFPSYKNTDHCSTYDDDAATFYRLCNLQLQYYHPSFVERNEIQKIFLVNAWNDWGHDMKIEPSMAHHFNYLFAFSQSLQEFSRTLSS